jgi:hypothetical protein
VDQSIEDYTSNLEKLELNYPYILVKNDRSQSVNHSRNQALAFYKEEEWLFFLDDDLRILIQAFGLKNIKHLFLLILKTLSKY